MKVVVNEREYEYISDYPEGWKFISKDYFKFPVVIGNANLFVKRFPIRKTNEAGLALLTKLRGKHEPHLPRVHDVVEVKEANKIFKYTFTNCISGITLNKLLDQGGYADLKKLALHLFSALASLHKYEYWFPDFCERNIFCENSGKYLLIDLDSCEPFSLAPDVNLDVSKDYWAPVFTYYKEILGIKLNPADLPGRVLNYLQLVFLIFQLKAGFDGASYHHPSDQQFNSLPAAFDAAHPSAREVFRKFYEASSQPNGPLPMRDIQHLVFREILNAHEPELEEEVLPEVEPEQKSQPEPEFEQETQPEPEIMRFDVTAKKVERKIHLEVKWETRYAEQTDLIREGIKIKTLGGASGDTVLYETYDGVNREITFELFAKQGEKFVKSEPVSISINDSFAIEEADQTVGKLLQFLGKHKWKIAGAAAVIILLILFIPRRTSHPQIAITRVAPRAVERNFTFVIQGDNFPAESNNVQVLFSRTPGRILYASKHVISAIVPDLGEATAGSNIMVQLVVDGDTTLAATGILFRHQ